MGTIVVTGVPGVGKTTVLEGAADELGLDTVVFGSQMLRVAKKEGLVEHRDEMRKLEPATQRDVQRQAADAISRMGRVFVDTHCLIQTPSGYLPGLPAWVAEGLDPETVVLVEADPGAISTRRADDETRVRDEDSPERIRQHQELNRSAATSVATLTGATVAVVRNEQGMVDEAVASLVDTLA